MKAPMKKWNAEILREALQNCTESIECLHCNTFANMMEPARTTMKTEAA